MAFNPDAAANSYESAPLPALQKKKAKLTPEEEEEERIKQEIWEAVEIARQERHEREERERKEREAKRKTKKRAPGSTSKPRVKPALPDDSEASEKLLQQRKKREADRKKFAQVRAAAANKEKANEVDIVIASPSSPKNSPPRARRNQTPGPSSAPNTESPVESRARNEPTQAQPIPMESQTRPSRPTTPQEHFSQTESSSPAENNQWQQRYLQMKEKYEAEQQGKARLEQVLAQYENTINSLMAEQENSILGDGSASSEEVVQLREEKKELQTRLATVNAELQAVSGDHEQLAARCKQMATKMTMQQKTEQQLRSQIDMLQRQLETQNGGVSDSQVLEQSEKLAEFRTAAAKQIEVLQLRYTKAESRITSLQVELQGKIQENEKLTQISDSLIAMLESANLDQ